MKLMAVLKLVLQLNSELHKVLMDNGKLENDLFPMNLKFNLQILELIYIG